MQSFSSLKDFISPKLNTLYSDVECDRFVSDLEGVLQNYSYLQSETKRKFTERDCALITYANSIKSSTAKKSPLTAFCDFIEDFEIPSYINTVHLLPFFPWDTDRGFSVMDYYKVAQENGTWEDIEKLGEKVHLMFDFVANHASIENPLVQNALIQRHLLQSDPRYKDYEYYKDFVIAYSDGKKPSDKELKNLARPRPNPVLTKYTVLEKNLVLKAQLGDISESSDVKILGKGWVWTTFSRPRNKDGTEATRQVDLNFANPNLLLETVKILLFYVSKNASLIRFDAIGYIWKVLGSSSIHEKQSHTVLEIIDRILDFATPHAVTIAEVNEPQDKVLTYLGSKGSKESDMVYQFTHFPLAVHAVLTEKTEFYNKWVNTLPDFKGRQFITIMGSHDGMGLKPVRKILPEKEINRLTTILIEEHKALPNHASLPGGKKIVYEICATPWNLVNNPNSQESETVQMQRYLVTIALGLMIRGLPAFYINGLIAAKNYKPSSLLDENRTVNREQFFFDSLGNILTDQSNVQKKVLDSIKHLLKVRAKHQAFDPNNPDLQVVDVSNEKVIALVAPSTDKKNSILGLFNITSQEQEIVLPESVKYTDILENGEYICNITIQPYGYLWLKELF